MARASNGTVKWFSEQKGCGFIVDESGVDHHFGVSDVRGSLLPAKGARVTFEAGRNRRGPKARNVELVGHGESEQSVSTRPRDRDDRVICGSCSRRMIPRVITGPPLVTGHNWTPVPKRSICPFCGVTYKSFPPSFGEKVSVVLFAVAFVAFATYMAVAILGELSHRSNLHPFDLVMLEGSESPESALATRAGQANDAPVRVPLLNNVKWP